MCSISNKLQICFNGIPIYGRSAGSPTLPYHFVVFNFLGLLSTFYRRLRSVRYYWTVTNEMGKDDQIGELKEGLHCSGKGLSGQLSMFGEANQPNLL